MQMFLDPIPATGMSKIICKQFALKTIFKAMI